MLRVVHQARDPGVRRDDERLVRRNDEVPGLHGGVLGFATNTARKWPSITLSPQSSPSQKKLRQRKIRRRRHLDVALGALDQQRPVTGALHRHRLVGDRDAVALRRCERRVSSPRRNSCGVSARQRASRGSVASDPRIAVAAFQRVAQRRREQAAAGGATPRSIRRAMSSTPHARARRVVHQHERIPGRPIPAARASRPAPIRCARPRRSRSARVCQPSVSSFGQYASSAASTTIRPAIRGHRGRAAAMSIAAAAGRRASTYCLGSSAPKRVPRPAAGTTHQSRSVPAIRIRVLAGLVACGRVRRPGRTSRRA